VGARAAFCVALVGLAACQGASPEERARAAAEQMRAAIPDVDATALAQALPADTVRDAQEQLAVVHEYQGELTGTIDAVTVNAIQAFQRAAGLPDTGLLDARTRARLAERAAECRRRGC
jgi:peptidoglycan hydrolase-like protein with peptidoglycan-binding domain